LKTTFTSGFNASVICRTTTLQDPKLQATASLSPCFSIALLIKSWGEKMLLGQFRVA